MQPGDRFTYVKGEGYRARRSPPVEGCIYALVDPRDGRVRYVGRTVLHPGDRAMQHYGDRWRTSKDGQRRRAWIEGMVRADVRPDVFVVDVLPVGELDDAEREYIALFRTLGCDLVNDAGDRKRLSFPLDLNV